MGYVFIANYLGISIAYWLSFGLAFINNGYSNVRWRFLLAFQCFPALLLLIGIKFLPDSPRYLASVGRTQESREVLEHIRGGPSVEVEAEFQDICAMAEETEPSSPLEFLKILSGFDKHHAPHLGRRAWLCIWLQIMASWTGITAVTAYSPVLLSQAGYSTIKQNGLAGGLNTIGIIGTIISAQIVDRLGRRTCLMGGAAGLALVNLIVGALTCFNSSYTDSKIGCGTVRSFTTQSCHRGKHCSRCGNDAVLVQSCLRRDLGNSRFPRPDRNVPKRSSRSRKRFWNHWLGDRCWMDSIGEPNHVSSSRGS